MIAAAGSGSQHKQQSLGGSTVWVEMPANASKCRAPEEFCGAQTRVVSATPRSTTPPTAPGPRLAGVPCALGLCPRLEGEGPECGG